MADAYRWAGIAIVTMALLMAGCLGMDDDELEAAQTEELEEKAQTLPWVMDDHPDHDHQDPEQHGGSWNMDLVGHHFLTHDPEEHPAWSNQLVTHEGFVFISAYEVPPTDQPGLIILNATNPEDPKIASTFVYDDVTPVDIFLSEDGDYAFLAGQVWYPDGNDVHPRVPSCTPDTPLPKYDQVCNPWLGHGVYAVNIEDPENPHFAGEYLSQPTGAHTVKYGTIDSGPNAGEYLFLASYGFVYNERSASSVDIVKIEEGPQRVGTSVAGETVSARASDELEFVEQGRYVLDPRPMDGSTFVHDTWFDHHPDTGDPLLFVAGWDAGVHIVDVSNPAAPEQLAVWDDYDGDEYGNIHSVYTPEEKIDGTYPLVVSPEYGSAPHSGKLWTVDVTDPESPESLGEFAVPGDPGFEDVGSYVYSPHNLLIEDGIAYHGHNHAGAWALDISTAENLTDPKPVGMYQTVPEDTEVANQLSHVRSTPSLWGVWVEDGLAYASDRYTGVYILELEDRHPGDPPWTDWDWDEMDVPEGEDDES